jgi:LysR family pca operon transcriptional activator
MRSKLARYMTNLEHFATVVEYGRISAAASVLAITQPALTRSVMRLEDVLGVQLLHRSVRGVTPTACGKALLEHIAAAEAELNKALAMIQSMKDSNGRRIHCGAGSVSMNHILPKAVSSIRKSHGKINIHLLEGHTHDLLLKLRGGELDVVLGIEQPDGLFSEFHSEKLVQERFYFCVRADHPLLRQDNLSLRDIMGQEKLVMPSLTGSLVECALANELERLDCSLNVHRVETQSPAVIRHLVDKDAYVALCSSIWFDAEIRSGAMRILHGDWNLPAFSTLLFRREGDVMTPPLEVFIEQVKDAARECAGAVEA